MYFLAIDFLWQLIRNNESIKSASLDELFISGILIILFWEIAYKNSLFISLILVYLSA